MPERRRPVDELTAPFPTSTSGNDVQLRREAGRNSVTEREWAGTLETTDHFVVVSADRIGYWLLEDLKSSMTKDRYDLLLQRGLLFEEG